MAASTNNDTDTNEKSVDNNGEDSMENEETDDRPVVDGLIMSCEPSTSKENTSTTQRIPHESSSSSVEENHASKTASQSQVNEESDIEMESVEDSSDEPEKVPIKLNKIGSKVRKRGYRNNKRVVEEDSEDCDESSDDLEDFCRTVKLKPQVPVTTKKEKPKPKWFVVPELISRDRGCNPLFHRRYYGSLHVVERLELMYKLEEHRGCVNGLNFNQKGNLLASCSDDLAVVIWDWSTGRKLHNFDTGHTNNVFQSKWLLFDQQNFLATCSRDRQVRLLDITSGSSRNLATHDDVCHKLAVHSDIPHVVLSAGEDCRVLSLDIRDDKTTELVCTEDVGLYCVDINPLNANEFCICGQSIAVTIYDRRKTSMPLHELYPPYLSDEFQIANRKRKHVTTAVYNYNGTEVLATYDEYIYLFDSVSPKRGGFAHSYVGHTNEITDKGASFFGPKSEFIICGSDCSNIFFWEKETEAIVNMIPGDERGVVNCLEPHPHIPVLATSGLAHSVKIWVPSADEPTIVKQYGAYLRSRIIGKKRMQRTLCSDLYQFLEGFRPTMSPDDDDDFHDEDDNDSPSFVDLYFFLG